MIAPSKFSGRRQSSAAKPQVQWRSRVLFGAILLAFLVVIGRLYYWSVIRGDELKAQAKEQYQRIVNIRGSRGAIYTSDGYLLAGVAPVYRLFAEPPRLTLPAEAVASQLHPYLLEVYQPYLVASEAAQKQAASQQLTEELKTRLTKDGAKWVSLMTGISPELKEKIAALNLKGLGFEPGERRNYPEASMSAHLLGFVGKNEAGDEVGYFGVEGALDKELRGRTYQEVLYADSVAQRLSLAEMVDQRRVQGRDVTLTVRRDVQYLIETELEKAIKEFGAESGEVIVMEPATGKILGMAAYPHHDPSRFWTYPPELYKNPSVSSLYEPGSIFKPITVSAGIDLGLINASTQCPRCAGPVERGTFTIKTWNNQYHANTTMTEALVNSDNTAMIFVADLLGQERFLEYLKKFGFGEPVTIDLQEEVTPPFPSKWGPVELATRSFGQGISSTTLQMLRAISVIANKGVMMRPYIVEKVSDPATGKEIMIEPKAERQVIKPETAQQVTQMMEAVANKTGAKVATGSAYRVAGKSGTAQIAVGGEYHEDQTIASYVAFSPPENPKFIMMVKVVRPSSSIWSEGTAAPLWYRIADRLYLLLGMQPDR
jgi:cell division protein FtsI/penicillin-binding protein 2